MMYCFPRLRSASQSIDHQSRRILLVLAAVLLPLSLVVYEKKSLLTIGPPGVPPNPGCINY
jgi:hypothetical protein